MTYGGTIVSKKSWADDAEVNEPVAGRGHTRLDQEVLHPRLRALELGAIRTGAKHQPTRGAETVGEAIDQRRFGADDEEIGVDRFRVGIYRVRDERIAGGDHHIGRFRQGEGQRVLARPRSDYADLHRSIVADLPDRDLEQATSGSDPGASVSAAAITPADDRANNPPPHRAQEQRYPSSCNT
jgi:hypothetical protein